MKTKTIALYLYFATCLTALVGIITDNELLLLFSKPMIIPAVFFYYVAQTRTVAVWLVLVLLLNFAGDAVILLEIKNLISIMVPYYLSYTVMIGVLASDASRAPVTKRNLLWAVLVALGHALMLYLVLDLQSAQGQQFHLPYVVYGVTLSGMVTLSVYNYLAAKTDASFYMLLACACSLVSDVFFTVYKEHYHLPVLSYINSAMQFATYIFLVKYVLKRQTHKRMAKLQRVHG